MSGRYISNNVPIVHCGRERCRNTHKWVDITYPEGYEPHKMEFYLSSEEKESRKVIQHDMWERVYAAKLPVDWVSVSYHVSAYGGADPHVREFCSPKCAASFMIWLQKEREKFTATLKAKREKQTVPVNNGRAYE